MTDDTAIIQQPVFPSRLIKILSVIERFREEAEWRNHPQFASALHRCSLTISGGDTSCPLGKLVGDESTGEGKARAGVRPQQSPCLLDHGPAGGSAASSGAKVPAARVLEWRSKYNRIWALLEEDARISGDEDCLDALEACNDLTRTHRCPVRELIVQGLWHGGNS